MTRFTSDMTLRWACREGDYVLWAQFRGFFARAGEDYTIADVWELRDGNFVTITNRAADLPTWFELRPHEAAGQLAGWMQRKLASGYRPDGRVAGPNLWRVFSGDRLAWIGPPRAGVESANGVLAVVGFRENALVYGEPLELESGFGGFVAGEQPPEAAKLCNVGLEAIRRAGLPRVASADNQWCIG
jgi:hypothetical protein